MAENIVQAKKANTRLCRSGASALCPLPMYIHGRRPEVLLQAISSLHATTPQDHLRLIDSLDNVR